MIVRIILYHLRKLQFLTELPAHRHTDESFSMRCHKVYIFRCRELCRTDEIPLILSVLVIRYQNDLSAF